jgi:uncharacterized membrane protein YjgN (DUF898 family)
MNEMIPPPLPARDARVVFTGQNGTFRRLVTLGALWEVLTFGFYRFWLTTNMRRHLWTHTSIEGDALEYTGRGRELLIGFLFALAVLMPIYLLFFFISIEAERAKAFMSLPLFLFFYAFSQFAVYRARRYRLTRTIWRGVRFWMSGSGWAYAARALAWQFLTAITLGLAYPWSIAALERYKIGHTFYGDLPGQFAGKGWEFFKRGWWLWLLCWIPVSTFVIMIPIAVALRSAAHTKAEIDQATAGIVGLFGLASLTLIIVPFIYAAFKAIEWKWWVQSIHFGELRFDSDLKRGALIGNYWKLVGMSYLAGLVGLIFMGIVFAIGFGLMKLFNINPNALTAQMKSGHFSASFIPVIFLYVFSYIGLIQLVGIVRRIYLVQRIWKIVVASVTIRHLDVADHVIAKGEAASAFGEGLADGLDLAGF